MKNVTDWYTRSEQHTAFEKFAVIHVLNSLKIRCIFKLSDGRVVSVIGATLHCVKLHWCALCCDMQNLLQQFTQCRCVRAYRPYFLRLFCKIGNELQFSIVYSW